MTILCEITLTLSKHITPKRESLRGEVDKLQREKLALTRDLHQKDRDLEEHTTNNGHNIFQYEQQLAELKKQIVSGNKDIETYKLEIDGLNKNLEIRTSTLKRTLSNLKELKKQQGNNPELIKGLNTRTEELSSELTSSFI